jgi:putative oxidoreductase
MNNAILLIARLLLAQIFLLAGIGKLGAGYASTQGYMAAMGVPGVLLPLVIALEIGGGLALIAGFLTRWAALALAGFCLVSAAIFHTNFGDSMQMIMFMKNLAMAGGLLVLSVHGPGAWSVDARRA